VIVSVLVELFTLWDPPPVTVYVTPDDDDGAVHESDMLVVAMDDNMGDVAAAGRVRTALEAAVVPPAPDAFTDCIVNV
jgi:hypothetical protein